MGEGDRKADAKPDVAGLLAEVEAAVAAKKSQGLYNAVEVRRVEEAAVTLRADPEGESMERLAVYLRENWDAKACGITTHRAGLFGRLVVGLKRLMHRLTRPYLNIALAQQTAFNNQLVELQSILVSTAHRQRLPLEQSEDRFDDTEARLTALERRLFAGNAQGEALLARLQRIVADLSQAGQLSPRAVQEVAEARTASRGAVLSGVRRPAPGDAGRDQAAAVGLSAVFPAFGQPAGAAAGPRLRPGRVPRTLSRGRSPRPGCRRQSRDGRPLPGDGSGCRRSRRPDVSARPAARPVSGASC